MRRCSAPCRRFLALLAMSAAVACGHGASLDGDWLQKGDARIKVGPIPSAWRRIEVEGADLAFRDDEREGSALFDVRCGKRDDDAPLTTLTEHLIMGTTDREYGKEEVVPFDGREALHTVLVAKLDGVPMQYEMYVMKKNGCVCDLVYVAPPGRFAEGSADFRRFALGVHLMPASPAADRRATAAP